MPIPDLLRRLLVAPGPSGHEEAVSAVWREAARELGAEIEADSLGSTVARLPGGDGPLLALVAHIDQIGMAVTHIGDDGLLSVHRLGAIARQMLGQRVRILTRESEIPGVVWRSAENDEKPRWTELYVDVGARNGDEARALVRNGDPAVLDAPPVELASGRFASGAIDDRAGAWVALESLSRLGALAERCRVAAVASTQEELGGHPGALAAIRRLEPDAVLVLETTYATDVPEADHRDAGEQRLGAGAAIFRGPLVHPRLFELLIAVAEQDGIAHSVETGATSMTDADEIFREGIPTCLLSIPTRRLHSAVETADLADLEATVQLACGLASRLSTVADWKR